MHQTSEEHVRNVTITSQSLPQTYFGNPQDARLHVCNGSISDQTTEEHVSNVWGTGIKRRRKTHQTSEEHVRNVTIISQSLPQNNFGNPKDVTYFFMCTRGISDQNPEEHASNFWGTRIKRLMNMLIMSQKYHSLYPNFGNPQEVLPHVYPKYKWLNA